MSQPSESLKTALLPAPSNAETELKLIADSSAFRALASSPAVTARARNRGTVRLIENVYYDTVGFDLRRRGLALRVRRMGRRCVQTLKTESLPGAASLLSRGEWEIPAPGGTPDLEALAAAGAGHFLEGLAVAELRPVFTTRVRRHRSVLDLTDGTGRPSVVEIAFDQGTLEAGPETMPLAEIELELKAGDPAALYGLALELSEAADLRIGTESKSDRGYRLAGGAPPARRKQPLPALDADDPARSAFAGILRSCLGHLLGNVAAAIDGRDPEGVHQVRVALRQLRSALPLFGHLIDLDRLSWLKGETKWIAGNLGPARDWDVLLTETLPPVEDNWPGDEGLAALREAAEEARATAYAAVRETLADPRCTNFVLQLGRWLEGGNPDAAAAEDERLGDLADRMLRKRHRAAVRAGRGFAELDAEARHEARIAVKKLRYAVGFFGPLYPGKRLARYQKVLKGLQTRLGRFNDRCVAERLLNGLPLAGASLKGAGLVLGWHGREAALEEERMVAAWEKFASLKPFWQTARN